MNNITDSVPNKTEAFLVVKIDGVEMKHPVDFGRQANYIETMYPYLESLKGQYISGPANEYVAKSMVATENESDDTSTNHILENQTDIVQANELQQKFWFNKDKEDLLNLSIRYALYMSATISGRPIKYDSIEYMSDEEIDRTLNQNDDDDVLMSDCVLYINVKDIGSIEIPLNCNLLPSEVRDSFMDILSVLNNQSDSISKLFADATTLGYNAKQYPSVKSEFEKKIDDCGSLWEHKNSLSFLNLAHNIGMTINFKSPLLKNTILLIDTLSEYVIDKKMNGESVADDDVDKLMSIEEANEVINDLKLESETDYEFNPGKNERDVPIGIGGKPCFDLYGTSSSESALDSSDPADFTALSKSDDMDDILANIIANDITKSNSDKYEPKYRPGLLPQDRIKNGILIDIGPDNTDKFTEDEKSTDSSQNDEDIDEVSFADDESDSE